MYLISSHMKCGELYVFITEAAAAATLFCHRDTGQTAERIFSKLHTAVPWDGPPTQKEFFWNPIIIVDYAHKLRFDQHFNALQLLEDSRDAKSESCPQQKPIGWLSNGDLELDLWLWGQGQMNIHIFVSIITLSIFELHCSGLFYIMQNDIL